MSKLRKLFLFALSAYAFSSCIDLFNPDIDNDSVSKYVVDGRITDQEGYQTVTVSLTSTFKDPKFVPVNFCKVKLIDKDGNIFNLNEQGKGVYNIWMGKEYLYPGNSFKVEVLTPNGIEIVSDFDQMPDCPDIDSVYFIRKDHPSTNPGVDIEGIQFYIDIERQNNNSKFYRWDIEETWEHHASLPITWYASTTGDERAVPPDYSRFVCWTTSLLSEIYTLSFESNTPNVYKMKTLHYVNNQSQRLTYGYSVLISQIALSEPAFNYWDNLRKNFTQEGGFSNSQPFRVKGNLKSTTNPELEILGFFSASSIKTKRIFVRNVQNFHVYLPQCIPPRLPLPKEKYKYFDYINGTRYIIDDGCVECDYLSGTTQKPTFWPYSVTYD